VREITWTGAGAPLVLDITNPAEAKLVPVETQAGTVTLVRFHAEAGHTYHVAGLAQALAPSLVKARTVKALESGLDYLATGPAYFAEALKPLLERRQQEGLEARYVDMEDLFDAYNFGRYGPEGIRAAARAGEIKYLLLAGRTHYDYKNYEGLGLDPRVPTFFAKTMLFSHATSDARFGDFGHGYPEIAIGRFPAFSADDLATMVRKTLDYTGGSYAEPFKGVLIADKADPKAGDFAASTDRMALAWPDMNWRKIYYGAGPQTDAEMKTEITESANSGAGVLVFMGHGNSRFWGFSRYYNTPDTAAWQGNLVLMIGTCTGNYTMHNTSAGQTMPEYLLTKQDGGICASIGPTTYCWFKPLGEFKEEVLRAGGADAYRWGDGMRRAHQIMHQRAQNLDAANALTLRDMYLNIAQTMTLLGDPALPFGKPGNVGAPGGGF
jgi:hypothetical protein